MHLLPYQPDSSLLHRDSPHYAVFLSLSPLFSLAFCFQALSPSDMRNQFSHPHKSRGKVKSLYILTFTF
jgi:hypothetical protein